MNNLPNDIGLLPGTFVRPVWRDLPSIFKNPRERWMMEWTSIKSLFQNYVRCVILAQFEMCATCRFSGLLHLGGAKAGKQPMA